jgi:hypothetical protein
MAWFFCQSSSVLSVSANRWAPLSRLPGLPRKQFWQRYPKHESASLRVTIRSQIPPRGRPRADVLAFNARGDQSLLLENDPAALATKCFEAALGVVERQTRQQSNEGVEDHAGDFSHGRLMGFNQRAFEGARANRYVVTRLNCRQKLCRFLNR